MSHHGLQRALVVALHDPSFVDAMHAAPEETLAPFGLDAAERTQLLAVDRRAFRVDPLRPRRVLKAISEELKGSLAIALAEARTLALADGFFASPAFRAAIAEDRPLVLALADYLDAALAGGALRSPQLPGVLAIERARAEARRDAHRAGPPGLAVAPGVRPLAIPPGALAALQAAERYLFELSLLPQVALCDDRPPLELPPVEPGAPLHLVARAGGGEVALTEIPEPLHRTLGALERAAARGRVDRRDMAAVLATVNLRVPDPDALVDDLVTEGYASEVDD
ncbi:MAG TPA: hypothetical protein VKZ63_04650 [Kofleriaceae bacterium]|nr:hypothetical protein [Kofleriaceae bacterium]